MINLVNGKFEMDQNGIFQLVEINDNCIKYCQEESIDGHNITAFWSVYKIRHRDEQRGYRYEWKITVRRVRNSRFDGKRHSEHTINIRSFVIRDQDYPQYFDGPVKKKQLKMEKRIFNTFYDKAEHPFELDYHTHATQYDRGGENLNIGEYYAKVSAPGFRYQIQPPQDKMPLTPASATHLHHHYFLNKDEVPIFKTNNFEKVTAFPGHFNALSFSNSVAPSQLTIPRVQNQLDSYGEISQTTLQAPFHFPEEVKHRKPHQTEIIRPTTYRGHYDDKSESILLDEVERNNFEHHHRHNQNQNRLITFPARHSNSIPSVTTSPSSHAINLNSSPTPKIQSLYSKPFTNPNGPHPSFTQSNADQYWFDQHPLHHQNYNFVSSFPYHENNYSELDPIYHGPLATPSDIPSSSISELTSGIHDADDRFVTQFPFQHLGDDSSYDIPTEVHQTTSTNTDPSFTTTYNAVTTAKYDSSQVEGFSHPIPDSINAQLPPPDSGTDIRVPYVRADKSTLKTKSYRKKNEKKKFTIIEDSDDENDDVSTGPFEKSVEKTTTKSSSSKFRNQKSTSSTEKPPWTPKRPRLRGSDRYKTNSELVKNAGKKSNFANRRKITLRKTTTTTEPTTIIQELNNENKWVSTVTHVPLIETEPRTSQSVQKSVSVHIAEKVTVIPRKSAKVVLSSKHGGTEKPRRVARIKKVEKSVEESTEP